MADSGNNTIRKIMPAAVVTTLAGLAGNVGSTDGTGSAARFSNPRGIAADSAGTLYVADTNNHTIRKVTAAGVVTTLAGLAFNPGPTDGTGSAARFRLPSGLTVDGAGTIYVADTNNQTICQVTSAGVVTTLAGTAQTSGNVDGTGSAARFNAPSGITVNGAGTLYVADANNATIRQIAAGAVVTTFAGAGLLGNVDGTGTAARFFGPSGVTISGGVLFVADTQNDTVRKITSGAVVTTLAGFNLSLGAVDGTGRGARFALPGVSRSQRAATPTSQIPSTARFAKSRPGASSPRMRVWPAILAPWTGRAALRVFPARSESQSTAPARSMCPTTIRSARSLPAAS